MTITDPTNLFGFLIQDLARLLSRTFEHIPGNLQVTRAQARVLAYVTLYKGATQTEIAALMDVQKIVVTKLVDELEQMELIERHPDPSDRRVRRLHVASHAGPVLDHIWQRLSEVSSIALAPLPAERAKILVQDLATIREHLMLHTASQAAKRDTT